jgi:acetyl-CoA/propionyl-CoA carboxylase carboxyl transferase subunit
VTSWPVDVTNLLREESPADPLSRLAAVVDQKTLNPDCEPAVGHVRSGSGMIDNQVVRLFCCDARYGGGALGEDDAMNIARVLETATREVVPVVGIWQSGGARLQDGTSSLDGMGRIFRAIVRSHGVIPHVSVVLGAAAGGAAYGAALSDFIVAGPGARIFVTGPEVVRRVIGEDVDAATLGGPEVHATRSGVLHLSEPTDGGALSRARDLLQLLIGPHRPVIDQLPTESRLEQIVPTARKQVYDMHRVTSALLDRETPPVELHEHWAPNVLTVFGRLGGATVGVLANNPYHLAGCLDCAGSDKAAAFVQKCDELNIPIVVLADVPGYLPGTQQESGGIVVRGARLLSAFAKSTVPRVTVIVRKAYGGAFIAMNSKSLGADAVYAWPLAEVGVMYPEGAVDVLHRRRLAEAPPALRNHLRARLAREYEQGTGGLERALACGYIDAVIQPCDTRAVVITALCAAPSRPYSTPHPPAALAHIRS